MASVIVKREEVYGLKRQPGQSDASPNEVEERAKQAGKRRHDTNQLLEPNKPTVNLGFVKDMITWQDCHDFAWQKVTQADRALQANEREGEGGGRRWRPGKGWLCQSELEERRIQTMKHA